MSADTVQYLQWLCKVQIFLQAEIGEAAVFRRWDHNVLIAESQIRCLPASDTLGLPVGINCVHIWSSRT
jgi:hypothetical protein